MDTHTDHNAATSSHDEMVLSLRAHLSSARLGIETRLAFLSIVVGIPDLGYTYMEPMEKASSNLHASGHTYPPQCGYILSR